MSHDTKEDSKNFSCLKCRERKVKCDRQNPCSNCTKTSTQCSFIAPVRGKRKRTKLPTEGLHAKLRRYEKLLQSLGHGAEIEPSNVDDDRSDTEKASESDAASHRGPSLENTKISDPSFFYGNKKRLVTNKESTRYFDGGLWSHVGTEFQQPEQTSAVKRIVESRLPISDVRISSAEGLQHDLVLGIDSSTGLKGLADLHPVYRTLQQMWEIFIERVDPITKVLHTPSFWQTVSRAVQNPHSIPRHEEAVIFAFYFAVAASLEEDECESMLGEARAALFSRYKLAARQALINAGFMKTSSMITLQAFTLYLYGLRSNFSYGDDDSTFILSGIAVRIGRRIGLHRDGTLLGLSPFETEMRRRLWCHIVHSDCRASDFSGTKPSTDLFLSDAKSPLNIEDEDISPEMTTFPPERTGITSGILCLIRTKIISFLCQLTSFESSDARWGGLADSKISLERKDEIINEIQDFLESHYLRHCDPSNSLHHFASIIIRSSICKMRVVTHNPRQFADANLKVPPSVRDVIFVNGTKLLKYVVLVPTTPSLRKFIPYVSASHIWDTLLYVLIETRHRKIGPEIDRVWQLIGSLFTNFPQAFTETTEELYAALGQWTLQVWEECKDARDNERARDEQGNEQRKEGMGNIGGELDTPGFIVRLRESRARRDGVVDGEKSDLGGTDVVSGNAAEPFASCDFSDLLSFDLEPSEWVQWDRLLSGQAF
ncbi:putative fungal-specific transcription factor [Microthyrium microscopicum]|uniref:Putative fungal-specific transcription factor n=1 Tax=Microthyrium microscopicum TaxID=703497 RepID=A0A6A6TV19_9PEZI|nr:putative fungal-specific transcription factor [Microthyrium microscopicum]